jgi:hypothetical protein
LHDTTPLPRPARYAFRAGADAGSRADLEHYVREAFARRHGARVATFMPHLVALRDRGDRLCAVAGYRGAGATRLYLEQYLPAPIEQAIAAATGQAVDRATVVEVGNLAAANCRAARHLAARLPALLLGSGYSWLAFTGTRVIRDLLAGFDAPLVDLGPADPARLGDVLDDWGTYYDSEPRVLAGYLPHGRALAPFAAGFDH